MLGLALRGATSRAAGQMGYGLAHGLERQPATQKRRKPQEDKWNRER